MRRLAALSAALVVLATSAVVLSPAATAGVGHCPDGAPCVYLSWTFAGVTGTHDHVFTATELHDLIGQGSAPYNYCGPMCPSPFPPSQDTYPCGVPIRALIGALGSGLTPDGVDTVAIHNPTNLYVAQLSGVTHDLDLSTADDFPFVETDPAGNKLYPIVFFAGATLDCDNPDGLGYIRPQRSATDQNYQDNFQTFSDGEIAIDVVFDHVPLMPTIHASTTSIKTGGKVKFTADLPAGSPGRPSYRWYLGEGDPIDTGHRPSLLHTYDVVAGTYPAYVAVTDDVGSSGDSDSVDIGVGPRPTPSSGTSSTPGNGSGTSDNPSSGPVTGSGLHGGAAPTTQVSGPHGPTTPVPTSSSQQGSQGQSASASSSGAHGSRTPARAADDGLVPVHGLLLDPLDVPVAGAATSSRHPEAAPAARRGTAGDSDSAGLGTGSVAAVAFAVLLVLGVLGESRRPARSRPRRARP